MTKRKRPPVNYYGPSAVRNNDPCLFAGFDTETDGLGGELVSIQWAVFDHVEFDKSPEKLKNFLDVFKAHPKPFIWFGHFAQYDWRYMVDTLSQDKDLNVSLNMRTENDVYEIRIEHEGGVSIMRDSYAIYPHPLADLAKRFAPEFPKMDLDFDKETFDPENPQHVDYAKRDVVILKHALPRYFNMVEEHFGVWPNATAASTALKAWQYSLPEGTYYNTSKWGPDEQFIREAYYGGLTFLTTTVRHDDVRTYDRNSSYPAVMCDKGVPVGRCIEVDDYEDERMGIYRVRVRAPKDLIVPILPARDHAGRMRWFSGEFDTICTNRELIFAAKHGYEILKVYEGKAWEEVAFPFNDFIEKCKKIRRDFKGSAEEFIAKLMQNSLYGKFGSRRERTKLLSAFSLDDEELLDLEPWDEAGYWYVQRELDEQMPCLPQWAVFITAHARLALLQEVYTIGAENVLYGDTDSITVKSGYGDSVDVGDEYGQWKLEKEWEYFRAIAPKVYGGKLLKPNSRGEYFIGAAKGMPRKGVTEAHYHRLIVDGSIEAEALSLPSLRVAMKQGLGPATKLRRKSSSLRNSVNFYSLPNGDVRCKIAA